MIHGPHSWLAGQELYYLMGVGPDGLGGSDEGAPGLRGPEEVQTYMAYARDLDGNKICAFFFG